MTNNFEYPDDDLKEVEALGGKLPEELRLQFDEFVESRIVGLRYAWKSECTLKQSNFSKFTGRRTRKPDPRIYQHACKVVGVKPSEAIFLDDIGMNLRAAKELGMTTIQVMMGNSLPAVEQLQSLVGVDLLPVNSRL